MSKFVTDTQVHKLRVEGRVDTSPHHENFRTFSFDVILTSKKSFSAKVKLQN